MIATPKHEKLDNIKMRDYLNAKGWANQKQSFFFIEMIVSGAYLQVQIHFDAIERFFFFIQGILDKPLYLRQWRSSKTHESKFGSSYMKPMF
jgi:hypothetical protein